MEKTTEAEEVEEEVNSAKTQNTTEEEEVEEEEAN